MNVLAKGTACLQCRQHKQKCDSLKPVCSRCQRYHKKCVYTSGLAKRRLGPPLAMVLEARALELEIRIHKLNLISTHDLSLASAKLLARIGGLGKAVGLQPILTRTNPIGSPNDRQLQSQRASVNQRPRSSGRMGFSDLSPVFSLYLINAFLLSRMQFYFSIDVPNFRRCLSLPPSHPDSIHPCLLNACYLGACARTRSELSFLEPYFLRRTRHFLHRSLMYADRITHFLRASLILGCYFVRKRRLNEFFTILDATSDLALACGLGAPGGTNGPDPAQYLLPRPKDVAEVIDRIQLAQSVYLLGQIAPIVGGSPPSFPYDNRWAMTSKDAALQYQYGEGFVLEEGCLSELWRSDGHLKVSLVRMSEKIMRFAQHSHEKGYGGFDEDYNFLRAQMNSQYSTMPPLRRASRTHSQKPAESFDLNISLVSVAMYGNGLLLHAVRASRDPDARKEMLKCFHALSELCETIREYKPLHRVQPALVVAVHVMNAIRVVARELQRPGARRNTKVAIDQCYVIELFLDVINDITTLSPEWIDTPLVLKDALIMAVSPLAKTS